MNQGTDGDTPLRAFSLPNQPERPARPGPVSGFIEDDRQIPRFLAAGGAGRVGPLADAYGAV